MFTYTIHCMLRTDRIIIQTIIADSKYHWIKFKLRKFLGDVFFTLHSKSENHHHWLMCMQNLKMENSWRNIKSFGGYLPKIVCVNTGAILLSPCLWRLRPFQFNWRMTLTVNSEPFSTGTNLGQSWRRHELKWYSLNFFYVGSNGKSCLNLCRFHHS